jgi:hypothetical protein
MAALEDEETQKRGIVVVVMRVGQGIFNLSNFPIFRFRKLRAGLPKRLAGIHLCNNDDDAFAINFTSWMVAALGSHARARFRSHHGMYMM